MKRPRLVLLAVLASLLALSVLAVESISATRMVPKVIRLLANGETVAEVYLLRDTELTVTGEGAIEFDKEAGRIVVDGATIELSVPGAEPITIKAERIEILLHPAVGQAANSDGPGTGRITYGFTESFRHYFGEEGMAEVKRAIETMVSGAHFEPADPLRLGLRPR